MQLTLETRGRPAKPLDFSIVRELTEADIVTLLAAENKSSIPPLQRITNRHHAVARLCAVGMPNSQIGIITGLTGQRVADLQKDPTFIELMEFYRAEVTDEYRTMNAQLAGVGEDALALIRERIETEPEKLSNTFLLDLVTKVADRTGNGPTSTSKTEVTVTLDLAARMKQAREAAARAIEGTAKDITPND